MSRKGGYKIIDFKHVEFTSGTAQDAQTHGLTGVFESIEGTNKRTILSGLAIKSGSSYEEFDDMEVHFMPSSGNMVTTVYAGNGTVQITITPTDTITITRTV